MKGTIQRLITECDGIPKKWGSKFPSHRNDFISEMKLGIMNTLDKYGKDVSAKLVRTIVGRRCQEYMSQIPAVRIPPTTGRSLKAKGKDTMVATEVYTEVYLDDRIGYVRLDTEDVIETICMTKTERKVLLLRLDGLTQAEIGDQLGLQQQRVSEMVIKIRRQFNDTKCVC